MSSRVIVVEYEGRDQLLAEFAQMLADELVREECDVDICPDGDRAAISADVVVLMGDVVRTGRTLRLLDGVGPRPHVVLWQLEPLAGSPPADENLASRTLLRMEEMGFRVRKLLPIDLRRRVHGTVRSFLLRRSDEVLAGHLGYRRFERVERIVVAVTRGIVDEVFVSTPERRNVLDAVGVWSQVLSIGYHRSMEPQRERERDIDVLFLGGSHPQRDGSLSAISAELRRRGRRLWIERGPIYGQARADLLGRARISLQIGHLDDEMPRMRAILSMAAGALVVTEARGDLTPFVPGEHLVVAPLSDIADTAFRLLEDRSELERVAAAGRRFVQSEVTMRFAAQQLINRGGRTAR